MNWKDQEQVREYHRDYWGKRRQRIIDFLGGQCVECGTTDQLEFDHIDPNEKSFNIKENATISNPEVYEELKKCQLLCKDCHEEKTAKENFGFTHGTQYGWMKVKCGCTECVEAKWSFYDKRNAKRRTGTRGPYKKNRLT